MEDIKHQIEFWKANEKKAKKAGNTQTARDSNFIVKGLELALSFVEKPCNPQMHVDAEPCIYCKKVEGEMEVDNFCKNCGRDLHQ